MAIRKLDPQEEAWRQFSNEIGGEFIEGGPQDYMPNYRVVSKVKQWTFTLSNDYALASVCITAPFVSMDGFVFTMRIYPPHTFSDLWNFLRRRHIRMGYPELDAYFIETNNKMKIRALFDNPKIRKLIARLTEINRMSVEGPHESSQLLIALTDRMESVGKLRAVFELSVLTLDQLRHIGSAS